MATKLGIIADVHANAPALQAVLSELDNEGSDGIVFLGDAIDIGPHPREVLDLLLARDDIRYVRGNHDLWYVDGPPRRSRTGCPTASVGTSHGPTKSSATTTCRHSKPGHC